MGCLCLGGSSEAGIATDFGLEGDLVGEIEEVQDFSKTSKKQKAYLAKSGK